MPSSCRTSTRRSTSRRRRPDSGTPSSSSAPGGPSCHPTKGRIDRRVLIFAALAALLGVYYGVSDSLWSASTWWDVGFLGVVLIPAVFAFDYFALPLLRYRGLPLLTL